MATTKKISGRLKAPNQGNLKDLQLNPYSVVVVTCKTMQFESHSQFELDSLHTHTHLASKPQFLVIKDLRCLYAGKTHVKPTLVCLKIGYTKSLVYHASNCQTKKCHKLDCTPCLDQIHPIFLAICMHVSRWKHQNGSVFFALIATFWKDSHVTAPSEPNGNVARIIVYS